MTLKQVFMINSDLKMLKGKIAVQVAHGEVIYMEHIIQTIIDYIRYKNQCEDQIERYDLWRNRENRLMKKIVVKASEHNIIEKLSNIKEIWYHRIYDRGLTQILENSLTCIVFEPLPEKECDELFGDLKLL